MLKCRDLFLGSHLILLVLLIKKKDFRDRFGFLKTLLTLKDSPNLVFFKDSYKYDLEVNLSV